MSAKALAFVLFASALSRFESCQCPSSHPTCEGDGKCYKRSAHSWSWRMLSCGSCTKSHLANANTLRDSQMGSSHCWGRYGSTWCYLKNKDGTFANSNCASYNGYGTNWCCPSRVSCLAKPKPKATLKKGERGSKYCYSYIGKTNQWCYLKKKDGTFATNKCGSYTGYGTDWCCPEKTKCKAALKEGKRGTSYCYSYIGDSSSWCYLKKSDGTFATSNCGSYTGKSDEHCCPGKTACKTSSSGTCNPSNLGTFIAKFVKSKAGRKVYSKKQGKASCWDLAWGAMEHAQAAGYKPDFYQQSSGWRDSYVWSSEVVPIEQAAPGDIAQFKGWRQAYKYAWNPHTAVVTECFKDGKLTTYEQNPNPVTKGVYIPAQRTSGSVTIYRLKTKSRLRLFSQMPQRGVPGVIGVAAGIGAIAGLLASIAFIVKRRRTTPYENLHEEDLLQQ